MLDLPNITLMCADGADTERAIVVLEKCKLKCSFGAVKLLTHQETDYRHAVKVRSLGTHLDYNVFMFKTAHEYVDTSHVLVVQHDGWILNTDVWNPEWLNCDYIGPLFLQKHTICPTSVGSGGFSLRSKALMQQASTLLPPWPADMAGTDYHYKYMGCYEDGKISQTFRPHLQTIGFKFATPKEASIFAQGGQCDPDYYVERPFGFHGFWHNMDREAGIVKPWPWPCPY